MTSPLPPGSPRPWAPILVFLLLAAGLAVAGSVYWSHERAQLVARAEDDVLVIARLKADEIARWLAQRQADAAALRDTEGFAHGVEAFLARGTPELEAGLRGWMANKARTFGYANVLLFDPGGNLRLSLSEATPGSLAAAGALARDAIAADGAVFADLQRWGDEIRIDWASPLVISAGGFERTVGAVVLRTDPGGFLYPLLQTWPTRSPSAETLIVRGEGESVIFLNELRHRLGSALLVRHPLGDDRLPAARAIRGEQGIFHGKDYRGVPVIAALRPVPGSPWHLVAKVDSSEVLGPVRVRGWWTLAFVALLLAAAGAGIAFFWRQQQAAFYRRLWHAMDRDAAERRQAEAALRASEESLATTLQSIGDAVIATDAEARIVRMNPVAEALTGFRLAEVAGRPLAEVYRVVSERTGRPLPSSAERVYLEGGVVAGDPQIALVARDGTRRPIADSGAPIRDAAGRISGVVLVFRDVTEERARQTGLAYQAGILASISDAVIGLDRDGTVRAWNRAAERIYGWKAEEIVGHRAAEVLHQAAPPALAEEIREGVQALRAAVADGGTLTRELRNLRRDGTLIDVESTAVALRDEGGGITGYVLVNRDVTERRRLQARLVFSDRMASVGTLAAGVAHEINNPLAYVLSNLDFALEELGELESRHPEACTTLAEARQALAEAREGGLRVRRIVRDLKTFSRADEEKRGPVDVNRVIESSIAMANNEIKHRARLVRSLAAVPPVLADESRLGQVFLNLLVNAVQAIPAGHADEHRIAVTSREEAGRVIVEVSDTGSGIPEAIRNRIFEPFFTTKDIGEGTGLGLAICHGIVASLGGEIAVESEPGRGSTFRITLPAAADTETRRGSPADARPATAPARILVVDDEPLVGRAIERQLGSRHEIHALTSARDAFRRVAAGERFDLILCDLMMPEVDGVELHDELARLAPEQAARMIFMTGGAFTPKAQTFLEDLAADRRLDKPFDADALERVVAGAMDRAA